MLIRINRARPQLSLLVALLLGMAWLLPSSIALAQAPVSKPAITSAKPITTADIKGISGPSPDDQAKGDPGGTITGTVNDIPVSDSKAGLTLADIVNTVGQNRIAINLVWTLITGYLVMFMQVSCDQRPHQVDGNPVLAHRVDDVRQSEAGFAVADRNVVNRAGDRAARVALCLVVRGWTTDTLDVRGSYRFRARDGRFRDGSLRERD